MNFKKFFELAKEAGINESELKESHSYDLSFSLFHGEIDSYETSSSSRYSARGIYNGKFGACFSDTYNSKVAKTFVDEIVNGASVIERDDPAIIFKGSPKYKKINTYNKDLFNHSTNEKIELLHKLEAKIKELDPRITEVAGVSYSESSDSYAIMNSYGLKLKRSGNYFSIGGEAVAKDGDQTKTGYYGDIGNDFSKIDIDEIARKIVERTVEQLHGKTCETGTYKAIIDKRVVESLTELYVSYASSESIQKRSSLFIDKLHTKIASRKITISDKPLNKSIFAKGFDAEGVATYNKDIIKNGVLETYLYNLTTAAKEGVETTGNAGGSGSKIHVRPHYIVLKPGKKSFDELLAIMKDGVYITSVTGLHSGVNPQSGSFSLQASGFMIENGKKTYALDAITVSGNVMDVFKDVIEVGSDNEQFVGSENPSILIKKIKVSGK